MTRSGSNQTMNFMPLRVSVVADGRKPLGKPLRIDFPRAGLPPAVAAGIPAGVHPPVIELDAFLGSSVDGLLLVRFVDLDSPRR